MWLYRETVVKKGMYYSGQIVLVNTKTSQLNNKMSQVLVGHPVDVLPKNGVSIMEQGDQKEMHRYAKLAWKKKKEKEKKKKKKKKEKKNDTTFKEANYRKAKKRNIPCDQQERNLI
eukprot:TRINITY_DN67278_c1_g1_i3.p1 TRINITY_DN67278_c1_g1~~TRINITY_DN67278_c1_g1_i3.p1  ORF type:complete len:116 (-),score=23.02 TRINITY_DN67278_c1_g1_i3:607-954(-)